MYLMGSSATVYNDNFTIIPSSSTNTVADCPSPVSPQGNIAITVIICVLLVAGLLGNTFTIAVIIKNRNLRTNFNRFLISLCASDLVSACFCSPLWLYRRTWGFDKWNWGVGLCKSYWLTDLTTNFTTALHILSFCVLRFMALSRPFTAPTTRLSENHFRVYIACLWLISLMIVIPFACLAKVKEEGLVDDLWPSCSFTLDHKSEFHVYSSVVYSVFFYLPAAIIFGLSIATIKSLQEMIETTALSGISDPARVQRIKRRNKAACLQMRLICACFAFGYIPESSYHIWASSDTRTHCDAYILDYWIGVGSYIILRVSECLNPVMYNIGCREMRQATWNLLKKDVFRTASSAARVPAQQVEVIISSIFQASRNSFRDEESRG